jgi:hypothetical protein
MDRQTGAEIYSADNTANFVTGNFVTGNVWMMPAATTRGGGKEWVHGSGCGAWSRL